MMPRTVVGLFDDIGTARRAEHALTEARLLDRHVLLSGSPLRSALAGEGVPVAAPEAEEHITEEDLTEALERHGVPSTRAALYAEAVRRGGAALIMIDVNDEDAERAASILQEHRPLDPSHRLTTFHELGHPGYMPTTNPFEPAEHATDRNPFADEHHPRVDVIYVM